LIPQAASVSIKAFFAGVYVVVVHRGQGASLPQQGRARAGAMNRGDIEPRSGEVNHESCEFHEWEPQTDGIEHRGIGGTSLSHTPFPFFFIREIRVIRG
jgi:hypothetical protein